MLGAFDNIDGSLIEKIFDPWTFQIFYFTIYLIVAICVIGLAYHLSNQIRLPYNVYLFFEKFESHCANIYLITQVLQKNKNRDYANSQNEVKCFGLWNCESEAAIAKNNEKTKEKMKITANIAKTYAREQCQAMKEIINDIEQFWMKEIESIENNKEKNDMNMLLKLNSDLISQSDNDDVLGNDTMAIKNINETNETKKSTDKQPMPENEEIKTTEQSNDVMTLAIVSSDKNDNVKENNTKLEKNDIKLDTKDLSLVNKVLEREKEKRTNIKSWFETMYDIRGLLVPAIGESVYFMFVCVCVYVCALFFAVNKLSL